MMVVDLKKLFSLVDPVKSPPWKEWKGGPITKEEVLAACEKGLPKQVKQYNPLHPESRQEHVNRIAFFFKNGWEDSPLLLTFVKGLYPIYDGTHRAIAAQLQEREWVLANVEGDIKTIKSLSY
jgi:hypothetical protein